MTERSTLFLLQEKTKIIGELQRDNEEYEALVETLSKQNLEKKSMNRRVLKVPLINLLPKVERQI